MQVYGRYERAFSKMHVTRMIHLCEFLGFMPMEMLFSAAPHLWGRTPEEARDTMELAQQVVSLPHGTKRDLLALVKKWSPWSGPQTERRRNRKEAKKDVFRRLALL